MDHVEEFKNLWIKFESLSRDMYKKFIDGKTDVRRIDMCDIICRLANKKISPYKEYEEFLKYCKDVRNDGSHDSAIFERKYMTYDESLFEDFRACINLIEKPCSVYSKSIHEVVQFHPNDFILDALNAMRDNDYTNIPITECGVLIGMLSETSIIKYLADSKEGVVFDGTSTISSFDGLTDFDKYSKNNVIFKGRNERYDVVVNEFIDKYNNNEKISCILITDHGKRDESIIGILTPWDIIGKD